MTLQQASALIDPAIALLPRPGYAHHWADLGCGDGLFTEALAGLLPAGSTVTGVDTKPSLRRQTMSNGTHIVAITADVVKDALPLQTLDGILMANFLHYVKDKPALLRKLKGYMRPAAPLIIVEYDIDTPVPTWVPYPVSYAALQKSLGAHYHIQKLGERPSAYGRGNMYAAIVTPLT